MPRTSGNHPGRRRADGPPDSLLTYTFLASVLVPLPLLLLGVLGGPAVTGNSGWRVGTGLWTLVVLGTGVPTWLRTQRWRRAHPRVTVNVVPLAGRRRVLVTVGTLAYIAWMVSLKYTAVPALAAGQIRHPSSSTALAVRDSPCAGRCSGRTYVAFRDAHGNSVRAEALAASIGKDHPGDNVVYDADRPSTAMFIDDYRFGRDRAITAASLSTVAIVAVLGILMWAWRATPRAG